MRFDDRLRTVLAQPAASPHDRAIRWRQLVELAARIPSDRESDGDLVDQAIVEIRDGIEKVEERVRIAAALAVASLPLSAKLVAAFAADRLSVAAPVLASTRLTASEWKAVASVASEECRAFIAVMRTDQTEPQQQPARRTATSPPPAPSSPPARSDEHPPIPSISEVVARIERLRHSRETIEDRAPSAPAGELPRLFRWECNETGEIDWVDGAPRGALVGQSIAQGGTNGGVDRAVERAFASRAAFHNGLLELPSDAVVGGTWTISGIPAFERASGRFAGYRGIAERSESGKEVTELSPEPDSLRELAHEIRTPLNAIIGFAEIIDGEYLGPAEGQYRQRAADIVAQARLLLSAVDDLDLAARANASPPDKRPQIHLGELVESLAPSLREIAAAKDVRIEMSRSTRDLTVAVEPELAQRLIVRMCTSIVDCAAEGERLRLDVDEGGKTCSVSVSLPASLHGVHERELFGPIEDSPAQGFPLRLVRGLARLAGAELSATSGAVRLCFPRQ